MYFGDQVLARVHRYDDAIMERLSRVSGASFVPIERVLERRRQEIERASPERAREILTWLERYYLAGAGERGRELAAELGALVGSRGG